MKNVLLLLFLTFSMVAYSQNMKIKWEDDAGREFAITAPSGNFSYGMLSGDNVSYGINGKVSRVGNVYISYGINGQVSMVGDVYISYDVNGKVSKVGNLYISYGINGKITGTSGYVRRAKRNY